MADRRKEKGEGRGKTAKGERAELPSALLSCGPCDPCGPDHCPEGPVAYHLTQATIALLLGRFKDVLRHSDQAIALAEVPPAAALLHRATAYEELGMIEEAMADYAKLIALYPAYPKGYNNRGVMMQRLQRLEEALADFDKALELDQTYEDALLNRGWCLETLGRLDEAWKAFKIAEVFVDKRHPRTWLIFGELGALLCRKGRYAEALHVLALAVWLNPRQPFVYRWRAETRLLFGDLHGALSDMEQYACLMGEDSGLAPKVEDLKRRIATAMLTGTVTGPLARVSEVIRRKAYTGRKEEALWHAKRARILSLLERNREALEDLEHALKRDPQCWIAHAVRAEVCDAQGMLPLAIEEYDRAISLRPDQALCYNSRGYVHMELGWWHLAKPDLEKARSLDPTNPRIYENLALYAWTKERDKDKALELLEEAFRLGYDRRAFLLDPQEDVFWV